MSAGKMLVADYRWLIDALKEHCDDVRVEVGDYDTALSIAALWNVPGSKVPHGRVIRCQFRYHEGGIWVGDDETGGWEGGEWKVFRLNELMVEQGWTREHVIATVIEKRPKATA